MGHRQYIPRPWKVQYRLKPRQCFICRKSPKGRRVQVERDGPLMCEPCAEKVRATRLKTAITTVDLSAVPEEDQEDFFSVGSAGTLS